VFYAVSNCDLGNPSRVIKATTERKLRAHIKRSIGIWLVFTEEQFEDLRKQLTLSPTWIEEV
jgi:hypothetical protein